MKNLEFAGAGCGGEGPDAMREPAGCKGAAGASGRARPEDRPVLPARRASRAILRNLFWAAARFAASPLGQNKAAHRPRCVPLQWAAECQATTNMPFGRDRWKQGPAPELLAPAIHRGNSGPDNRAHRGAAPSRAAGAGCRHSGGAPKHRPLAPNGHNRRNRRKPPASRSSRRPGRREMPPKTAALSWRKIAA